MGRATAIWIAGALVFAVALEIVFRILPVSTSTATAYFNDPAILTYPAHHRWTTSTGWDLRNAQSLRANNLGFVAERDFEPNPRAVALIGDSFTEASMLDATDRPGAQLERMLASRPVFAAGSPGTALLDYAERIRFMHERFGIRDFVVMMERSDVVQSLCGSGNVHGPCLDPKTLAPRVEPKPDPDWTKRILRQSALAQYLVSQLSFSPLKLWKHLTPPDTGHAAASHGAGAGDLQGGRPMPSDTGMAAIDTITRHFFERVRPHVTGKLVIVLDTDRNALYAGKPAPDPHRARFMELARSAGATVVDADALVADHLSRSTLKLDVGPYDGHLNRLGVALYMGAAAAELAKR